MTVFLALMLSVLLILAWSILGNIIWYYRESREHRNPGNNAVLGSKPPGRKLPLHRAVPLALVLAWLIVHFVIRP